MRADRSVSEYAEQRELAIEARTMRPCEPPTIAQRRGDVVLKRRVDDGGSGPEPVENARSVVAHLIEVGLQLPGYLDKRVRARGDLVRLHGCRACKALAQHEVVRNED